MSTPDTQKLLHIETIWESPPAKRKHPLLIVVAHAQDRYAPGIPSALIQERLLGIQFETIIICQITSSTRVSHIIPTTIQPLLPHSEIQLNTSEWKLANNQITKLASAVDT